VSSRATNLGFLDPATIASFQDMLSLDSKESLFRLLFA
jgi:hypothetical protein